MVNLPPSLHSLFTVFRKLSMSFEGKETKVRVIWELTKLKPKDFKLFLSGTVHESLHVLPMHSVIFRHLRIRHKGQSEKFESKTLWEDTLSRTETLECTVQRFRYFDSQSGIQSRWSDLIYR